ncbi:MAG: hypothetical protein AAGC60_14740 [Acidobacteriota bacterium]
MANTAHDLHSPSPAPALGEHPESDGPRALQIVLVAAFLLALVAVPALRWHDAALVPFVDFAAAARSALDAPDRDADKPGSLLAANRRLLAVIDAFEGDLEDSSPLRTRALSTIQGLRFAWGGVGNESTYRGRDGWLVFRDGYDTVVGRPFLAPAVLERRRDAGPSWREPVRPDPLPVVVDFARQLAARNIDLVVVLVPTKLTVHPEALAAGLVADLGVPRNPSTDALLDELEADGVELLDASSLLIELRDAGTPAFLRTDSHWTPAAVDVVAREIAAHLRPRLDPPPSQSGSADETVWWRRTPRRVEGRGDLYRLLALPEAGRLAGERLVASEAVEIQVVSTADDRLWRPERGSSVLLLGDSFSNVFSESMLGWGEGAGLGEQLSYHLGRRIDRLAVNDGSASTVRERLAADAARLDGVRVVVWQIAARELASGDWRPVARQTGNATVPP